MSATTMADAFAPVEAKYREDIIRATWGHLAPIKNKTYRGRIIYAIGCFGNDPLNPTALSCEFEDLDSSPWFFDTLSEFLGEQDNEEGCVYEFVGKFRNYEFKGEIKKVYDAARNG